MLKHSEHLTARQRSSLGDMTSQRKQLWYFPLAQSKGKKIKKKKREEVSSKSQQLLQCKRLAADLFISTTLG